MKTKTPTVIGKIFNSAFITLSSLGLSYSLINNFILDKPNKNMLLVMICLFFASIASWQRKKQNK